MKLLTFAFLTALTITAHAQEADPISVFDAHWQPTNSKKPAFLLHKYQISDTCWQFDYYHFTGPMVRSEQYRDEQGLTKNGDFRYYNEKGKLDSTGYYQNGKKNGNFYKLMKDSLKGKWEYIYRDDSLISVTDLESRKKDSSISYKDEKESEYPGGLTGWYHYLGKHLIYPDRAVSLEKMGQVLVRFVVDAEGNVSNCFIANSVEYSLDNAAIKTIQNSGKWIPAFQNNHNVKSYKSQPINFKMEKG